MSRHADKQTLVYNFLLTRLEKVYNDMHSPAIRYKKREVFPTKTSLVNLVFSSPKFCKSGKVLDTGQIDVSYSTVKKAINALITENKITKGPAGYEFVPQISEAMKKHPILNISSSIGVEINVPENILFLRVDPGMSEIVSRYLSSVFYNGDALFIPQGNFILCVSVYPEEVIYNERTKQKETIPFLRRIEAALSRFDLRYPQFLYGLNYEFDYTAHYDELTKNAIDAIIASYDGQYDLGTWYQTEEELRHRVMEYCSIIPSLLDGDLEPLLEFTAAQEKRFNFKLSEEASVFFDDTIDEFDSDPPLEVDLVES